MFRSRDSYEDGVKQAEHDWKVAHRQGARYPDAAYHDAKDRERWPSYVRGYEDRWAEIEEEAFENEADYDALDLEGFDREQENLP